MELRGTVQNGNGHYLDTDIGTEEVPEKEPEKESVILHSPAYHEEKEMAGKLVDAETLYKPKYSYKEDSSKIVRIHKILFELKKYLDDAKENFEDEITKECTMNLFAQKMFELVEFMKIDKKLRDLINILIIAVESQITEIYTQEKIKVFYEVISLFQNTIYIDDEFIDKCFDMLENSGYDLNAPMKGLDLPS